MQIFINTLADKYSRATIKRDYSLIKQILRYAINHNAMNSFDFSDIVIPIEQNVAIKKKPFSYLEPEDMQKLYIESKRINIKGLNCGGINGERVYGINADIAVFIAYTGLRVSELKALKWEDIDFENKEMHIHEAIVDVKNRKRNNDTDNKYIKEVKTPKNLSSIRIVPLGDKALEMIANTSKIAPNHKQSDYVFINKEGNTCSTRNITRTLKGMLDRAGCKDCTVHGLRHSFGSLLYLNGVSLKYISEALGHSSITTTSNIYINLSNKEINTVIRNNLHLPNEKTAM